ncbi:unnamed protein product [Calypogeia fissa]
MYVSSLPDGAVLSMATNSAFRWSQIGEVSESLTLSSRSMDEFYPELRVHLERPPETIDCVGRTFDCVGSPQFSRSPSGRNVSTANACTAKQDKVKVYVRMRPFSESEKVCPLKQVLCLIGETIVVRDLDQKLTGISKETPHKAEAIEFKVDYMQDDSYLQVHSDTHKEESQKRMYGALGVPCIESALDGYNTTILAYGQTGSGKTYTMMGDNTTAGQGLIPRLANDLMRKINEVSSNGVLYTVQVSYLEIYQEKIRDLLAEDEVEEESKTTPIPHSFLDLSGVNSNEKARARGSNPELKSGISGNTPRYNLDERVIHTYPGSLTENSYTSSFLNKAALQRQLEASQRHSKVKGDGEKSPLEKPQYSSAHDGVANKLKSPKTKPAFDTVFNKQKLHKHYRTFPTVLEEAPPVRKQNFLKIREHPITGPFVEGLLWKDVCTWYDMETLMKQGSTIRTTAATDMNEQSSRSHAIFSIRLTKKLGPNIFGVHPSSVSYINLVDLAGSEKLPKLCSGAVTGQRTQEESRCINRSLSQLNEVILSLSKSSFVSYRNSVLTWLLKESLGGNSRTFMVANISPTEKDLRESINTLRYATTASRIPPPITLDQDPRNKLIKALKEEICTLRTLLSSFTSVKENAPSDRLPSLQGFKVPCLDVGLQVEGKSFDRDGSRGRKLHQHLDKGSQTETYVRDSGQQTRSGSRDASFQIAVKDGGALDMGNPTVLQDSGRVDFGHQTLTLNICACDSAHQAFAEDFGVMDVGLQVALRELGIVSLSAESTLNNRLVEDVCYQSTRQGCVSIYLGPQDSLRDCGTVNVRNQVALRDSGNGNVGNQLPLQNCKGIDSWNQATGGDIDDSIWVTLQDKDEVTLLDRKYLHASNQIKLQNSMDIYGVNQITSPTWRSAGPGNQIVNRDSGNIDAGHQINLRNWGDVHAETHISSTDWSPVDIGLQGSDLGGIDVRTQKTGRDLGLTDAYQTNSGDHGSKDLGHQTRFRDHGVDKATNCYVVHWDVSNQSDWRDFGASDVGLQVTLQKPLPMGAGHQVSWVEFGASDNGEQISWRDFGTSDAQHQTTAVDDQGAPTIPHNFNYSKGIVDEPYWYSSTAHDDKSMMISKETFASAIVNPNNGYWRSKGAVGVGNPDVVANLGAIDVSYESGLRVGLVDERKAQFERRSLSDMRCGQHRTLLKPPDFSDVQQPYLRGVGAVRIEQTSLKVKAGEDKESQSDWNHLAADIACPAALQGRLRAIDVQLQTNWKTLGTHDVGLQTNWDSIGVEASQLGMRDDNAVHCGCNAIFENDRSVDVRHQSTSIDFLSLAVDCNSSNTCRAVEAWQRCRCRVCGASQDQSVIVLPTTVPIHEFAANVGLQMSSIDFCATVSELQTPTTGCWGVSSDADPITPKVLEVLEVLDEGSEVDREEGHPCQEQYQSCWKLLGAIDFKYQPRSIYFNASKPLDLEDRGGPPVDLGEVCVGRQNQWEEYKIPNSGCQNCEHESLAQRWQYQTRHVVDKDSAVHKWHHHHEITLSEPSYLVTESDDDTLHTDEEASWNASWGSKHQNSHVYRDHIKGMEFLRDVKLTQVGASNGGDSRQFTHCRVVETGVQAFPRDSAIVQDEQKPGSQELEDIDHITEERFDSVRAKTRFPEKGDGDFIDCIPQTQTIDERRSLACDSNQKTHQQRYSIPGEHLEVHGECENGRYPDGKVLQNQNSVCSPWLDDLTGQSKRSGNVPAEEAFHLCSLWTLAKLRSRMEWYGIRSEKKFLKYKFPLAPKCCGLFPESTHASKAVATQTASCPDNSVNRRTDLSNALQHISLLWVFIILRIAAPDMSSLKEGKCLASKRLPFLALSPPRKIRILSYHSDSAIDEGRFVSRRDYTPSRLRHLRYSGVESLTFKTTTPFFIQTSGNCSFLRTRVGRSPRAGNTATRSRSYKITRGFPSRRVVHFLKEGVNRLGSNTAAHIFVNGISEDHTEFIYMPARRCVQKKGYVVARLVSPGAVAFLNGLRMLDHRELCTGDVLVLRDLRYWSSVCTLHFFDLVKLF